MIKYLYVVQFKMYILVDGMDEDIDRYCSVDIGKGLVVALDIRKHTFGFIAGQESYGVASASISGKYFYPFMIYNGQAHKPIRIQYLGGPKSKKMTIKIECMNLCIGTNTKYTCI